MSSEPAEKSTTPSPDAHPWGAPEYPSGQKCIEPVEMTWYQISVSPSFPLEVGRVVTGKPHHLVVEVDGADPPNAIIVVSRCVGFGDPECIVCGERMARRTADREPSWSEVAAALDPEPEAAAPPLVTVVRGGPQVGEFDVLIAGYSIMVDHVSLEEAAARAAQARKRIRGLAARHTEEAPPLVTIEEVDGLAFRVRIAGHSVLLCEGNAAPEWMTLEQASTLAAKIRTSIRSLARRHAASTPATSLEDPAASLEEIAEQMVRRFSDVVSENAVRDKESEAKRDRAERPQRLAAAAASWAPTALEFLKAKNPHGLDGREASDVATVATEMASGAEGYFS